VQLLDAVERGPRRGRRSRRRCCARAPPANTQEFFGSGAGGRGAVAAAAALPPPGPIGQEAPRPMRRTPRPAWTWSGRRRTTTTTMTAATSSSVLSAETCARRRGEPARLGTHPWARKYIRPRRRSNGHVRGQTAAAGPPARRIAGTDPRRLKAQRAEGAAGKAFRRRRPAARGAQRKRTAHCGEEWAGDASCRRPSPRRGGEPWRSRLGARRPRTPT